MTRDFLTYLITLVPAIEAGAHVADVRELLCNVPIFVTPPELKLHNVEEEISATSNRLSGSETMLNLQDAVPVRRTTGAR